MELDHYNVRTSKLAETVRFYEDVVGLKSGFRPSLPMDGAWLYADETAKLHLMDLPAAPSATGPLDHVAFAMQGLGAFIERVDQAGVARVTRKIPGTPVIQVQLLDPNGVMVEANFSGEDFAGQTDALDFDAHRRLAELRVENSRRAGVARANGVATAYESCGAGPLLVLIHGAEADKSSFAPVLPALSARFTCVTFDQRDTGATANSAKPYAIADLADDAAALIAHLGGRAHVWGTSFGGMIGQELAIRHPGAVGGLALSVTFQKVEGALAEPERFLDLRSRAAGGDAKARAELTAMFFSRRTAEQRPELVESLQGAFTPRPPEAQARRTAAGQAFDSQGRAGAIAAPTLVLGAREDRVIDPANSWKLAREIPGAALTVLDGVGHALAFEDPDRVAAVITAHLLRQRT
ncbi:MAG TPA: alpha/beta fold hydrolase [Caulobacteraceae bacterium]|nr:alpha/beta fold hydrolase [Caulobacteraceae bacterium]